MLSEHFDIKKSWASLRWFSIWKSLQTARRERCGWLSGRIWKRLSIVSECVTATQCQREWKNQSSLPKELRQYLKMKKAAIGVPYREAIGSLMYLIVGSQLDVAYAVSKRARFCEKSKWKLWVALKRVLRYVNGISNVGLCIIGLKTGKLAWHDNLRKQNMFCYADFDWAGDVSNRKSTGSYVFMMSGSADSWCFKKHTVVSALSCWMK